MHWLNSTLCRCTLARYIPTVLLHNLLDLNDWNCIMWIIQKIFRIAHIFLFVLSVHWLRLAEIARWKFLSLMYILLSNPCICIWIWNIQCFNMKHKLSKNSCFTISRNIYYDKWFWIWLIFLGGCLWQNPKTLSLAKIGRLALISSLYYFLELPILLA